MSYREQESTLTLQEGLDEFHSLLKKPVCGDLSPRMEELFHCHDLCHVIFGLGPSLIEETLADTITILGSDVGFKNYIEYIKEPETLDVLQNEKSIDILKAIFFSTPHLLKAWRMSRHMTKKWPFYKADRYLENTLHDLRSTYNIKVLSIL